MKKTNKVFFLCVSMIAWNAFSEQINNQIKPQLMQFTIGDIAYSIEGKTRYIEIKEPNDKYNKSAFVSHIARGLLSELLLKNGMSQVSSVRYLSICERDIPFSEKQRNEAASLIPRLMIYARGIIALNKEKVSAEDVFSRLIKVEDAKISENEWIKASRVYSLDWAEKFMKYDRHTQINSLLYVNFITMAYYVSLKDKMIKELQRKNRECSEQNLYAQLQKQLESFSVVLPVEYEELKSLAIQKACDIIFKITPVLTIFKPP